MRIVPLVLVALVALPLAGAVVLPSEPEHRIVYANTGAFVDEKDGRYTHVKAGSTVTWIWTDLDHSVTEGGILQTESVRPPLFDSGVLPTKFDPRTKEPITKFSHTFEEPGVYSYYCKLHHLMRSVVVVSP